MSLCDLSRGRASARQARESTQIGSGGQSIRLSSPAGCRDRQGQCSSLVPNRPAEARGSDLRYGSNRQRLATMAMQTQRSEPATFVESNVSINPPPGRNGRRKMLFDGASTFLTKNTRTPRVLRTCHSDEREYLGSVDPGRTTSNALQHRPLRQRKRGRGPNKARAKLGQRHA